MSSKPTLIFFQFEYDSRLPAFLHIQRQEHVQCLEQFFDVKVIRHDCDYQEICDRYEPDLALFETALEILDTRRLRIRNPRCCPQVPKLAFLNADGCSELRPATLSDLHAWDIDTCFTISCCAHEHMEPIARNLFLWPNFIDPSVHRDHGLMKTIPVMLSGSLSPRYPWRREVYKQVAARFPALFLPHRGYLTDKSSPQMLHGISYARIINASMIAPTCGSVVRDLVRKHLEIPGSKSCLITEDTPALRAAGFEDMVSCVFADRRDVLDKIAYLFAHPDTLEAITSRGHDLVHARHTISARDQIFQWYTLNRSRRQSERIVQPAPFGPLTVVDESSPVQNIVLRSGAVHLQRLAEAREALAASRLGPARELFEKVLSYLIEFPEAKLGMAATSLALGDVRIALSWILGPLRCSLLRYRAAAPDPVEWAWLIVCLLCQGKLKAAKRRAEQYTALQHHELDLARRAVMLLSDPHASVIADAPAAGPSVSIHPTASRTLPEFLRSLADLLDACQQVELARQCRSHARALRTGSIQSASQPARTSSTTKHSRRARDREGAERASEPPRSPLYGFDDPLLWHRLAGRARRQWDAWKAQLGVLLHAPGRGNRRTSTQNDLVETIRALMNTADVTTALLVSAHDQWNGLQSLTQAAGEAGPHARLYSATHQRIELFASANYARSRPNAHSRNGRLRHVRESAIATHVAALKRTASIPQFDVVIIATEGIDAERTPPLLLDEAQTTRFVVIDSLERPYGSALFDGLLALGVFRLLDSGMGDHDTYAVLNRWKS
jgi:hypothetical protein